MDCTGTIMAVASAAVGTVQPPRMKGFCNSVTVTFFQLLSVDKDGKPVPAATKLAVPNFKQCHQMDIEQLKTKEKPQISQIVFMSGNVVTDGKKDPQLMILCTNYGLLVFDFALDLPKEESKEEK